MTHLDGGAIVSLRDGALVLADTRAHLTECSRCAEAYEEAGRRATTITDALKSIAEPVDVAAAKARVRDRLDGARAAERPRRMVAWQIGRAAALLLLGAGAVYAVPGSPVRDWIGGDAVPSDPHETATAPAQEARVEGGIEVALQAGRIEIALSGVPLGAEVAISWVDEPVARIAAGAGSRYGFAEGRAEAVVSTGPVYIEVSRSATSVVLEINGRIVLRGTADAPVLDGDVVTRSSDRIVFSPER